MVLGAYESGERGDSEVSGTVGRCSRPTSRTRGTATWNGCRARDAIQCCQPVDNTAPAVHAHCVLTPAQTRSGRVVVTLHRLVGAVDAASDALLRARTDYDLATVTFLSVLADAERPDALGDPADGPAERWVPDLTTLAECLGVTRAAVSKRVPRLVAQGLVRTSADPHHARRVRLALTDEGAAVVATSTALLEEWLAGELAGRLDLEVLHTALTDALAALAPQEP